jgi:hypothetical protein
MYLNISHFFIYKLFFVNNDMMFALLLGLKLSFVELYLGVVMLILRSTSIYNSSLMCLISIISLFKFAYFVI